MFSGIISLRIEMLSRKAIIFNYESVCNGENIYSERKGRREDSESSRRPSSFHSAFFRSERPRCRLAQIGGVKFVPPYLLVFSCLRSMVSTRRSWSFWSARWAPLRADLVLQQLHWTQSGARRGGPAMSTGTTGAGGGRDLALFLTGARL